MRVWAHYFRIFHISTKSKGGATLPFEIQRTSLKALVESASNSRHFIPSVYTNLKRGQTTNKCKPMLQNGTAFQCFSLNTKGETLSCTH